MAEENKAIKRNGRKADLSQYFGKTYNQITILREVESPHPKRRYVECLCSCGKVFQIRLDSVLSSHTRSCGCASTQEKKDRHKSLIGRTFGRLTPIERIENKGQMVMYRCSCSCGGLIDIPASGLLNSHSRSCGCLNSKGERLVGYILKANDIPFIKQRTLNDLRTYKNGLLRFDFYLPTKDCYIEYDGAHHFRGEYWKDPAEVEYHDRLKNEYCERNNIPLIRIPYTHYNYICLADLLPETSGFLVK